MFYSLHDLLIKMGAPEVREKGRMEWHYFDRKKNMLAGFAEIRLDMAGERLVAEMRHLRENYTDDAGTMHPVYTESFHLIAERTARPGHYRISKLSLDGEDYHNPSKSVIELGLSVFHARALDISIRMMEQVFNKQDILETASAAVPEKAPVSRPLPEKSAAVTTASKRTVAFPTVTPREGYGVVLQFRPRTAAGAETPASA